METIYIVLEYWLTDADWDDLRYRNSHSDLHEDEHWYDTPKKSGPNIFAVTTRELVNKLISTRREAHKDHVKASEEHNWEDCKTDNCTLCDTRRPGNETTYSYEIKEVTLVKENN